MSALGSLRRHPLPPVPRSPCLLGAAAVVFALTGAAGRAQAEPAEATEAESARIAELNEAGARAYNGRNYRVAIEKFVEAYAIDHDPNLLFNIARAYEKLGEIDAASEKYEAFLKAPGADTEGRLKAKASLAELEKLREQGATSPPGSASPAEGAVAPDESSEPSPLARALPWATLGAGAVATGVGVTLYALGMRDHRSLTDTAGYGDASRVYPLTRAEAQAYVDSGDTKKLIGGVCMGVGGALVVTGVVLLVTGKSSASSASETAGVTFAASAHGVYAGYTGRF